MNRNKKVVRVVLPDGVNELSDTLRRLLECMRYGGLVKLHRQAGRGESEADYGVCFDLANPTQDEQWATMMAERMSTFGFNAVVAPPWVDDDDEPRVLERVCQQCGHKAHVSSECKRFACPKCTLIQPVEARS